MKKRNSESSMTHKRVNSRNLRAKVRSLLPLDICCKYLKRNDRVEKLQNRREQWDRRENSKKGSKGDWSISHTLLPSFFRDKYQRIDPKHMFGKLAPPEIEQICDHKLYFVGEKHIQDFDDFVNPKMIEQKESDFTHKAYSTELQRTTRHNQTAKSLRTTFRRQQMLQKWHSTQIKIRQMHKDDVNMRDTQKVVLQLRLKRAKDNLEKMQQNQANRFQLRKSKEIQCQQRMNKTRQHMRQSSEIDRLVDELRGKVCFHRSKMSA